MPTFNIQYVVGVDGINVLLVLLTTLCVPASWEAIDTKVKLFMSPVLFFRGALIIIFTALDSFPFFMLWEGTLIPMCFIIVLWGGPNRIVAGLKLISCSWPRCLLLLAGILGLYLNTGQTLDLQAMAESQIDPSVQLWILAALFLHIAIKLPIIPFHIWLPDAHWEAPAAGSVILAGVLLKIGGHGFIRICLPVLPQASAE